ncbi:GUN4 domain-containing protein [Leptolyngbya sp. NIES-2104]|uniref:GUN4 domain-containing protein n=1 Tax=Leptolyngbya sp. NIES-2104 TaxID=1552121 RepID=UPI0006EC6837|nr:GUN4 domain-containing protein [Leptolyngbya sp. NIES-2104]GAP94337.1 serine/threonine kinase [Leptolyngbya sp. NIES-2104]
MKILFLSANPPGSARLDLEEEVSRIEEGLQRSKLNGQFELVTKWAIDSHTLRRALLEENPDVVHFSGHGEGQSGLVLLGQNGQAKPATGEALSGLFKQFPNVKCVLLNACYAEVQAKAIVQHVEYVIGMKQAVRDDAAIAFATGFYDGLGYAKSIEVAFELGRNAVQFELASFSGTTRKLIPVAEDVEPLPDHLIPVLLKKEPGSTKSAIYSNRSSEASSFSQKLRTENNITQTEAVRIYRERVQEFLSDRALTPIETAQLAILAKILGLSETEVDRILQEEQNQQSNVPSAPTGRSWFQSVSKVKNYLIAGAVLLTVSAGGFFAYEQSAAKYPKLQSLLSAGAWKDADEETARILRRIANRQQDEGFRAEDFKQLPCSELISINNLWEKYSNNHFGFRIQKQIWNSTEVNNDINKFSLRVGWLQRQNNGSLIWVGLEQASDLSAPSGRLPLTVTYRGGDGAGNSRSSYLDRLTQCIP